MPKQRVTKEPDLPKVEYDPQVHLSTVRQHVSESGGIYSFCAHYKISDLKFHRWTAMYPDFNEQYRVGLMESRWNWEREGDKWCNDPDWNMTYWERIGEMRYNAFKSNKIRVNINPEQDPHEQYKQLIIQAASGDFTSAELKQLMESVNVGVRAYEVFKQQGEIDKLREDLNKMSSNNASDSFSDSGTEEGN